MGDWTSAEISGIVSVSSCLMMGMFCSNGDGFFSSRGSVLDETLRCSSEACGTGEVVGVTDPALLLKVFALMNC